MILTKIWGIINILFSLALIPGFVKFAIATLILVSLTVSSLFSLPSSSSPLPYPESPDPLGMVFFLPVFFAFKFLLICGTIIFLLILMRIQFNQLKVIKKNKTVSKKNIIFSTLNSLAIILMWKANIATF